MARYIVGFTGSRAGMTAAQRQRVTALLRELIARHASEALCGLHGDCLGADADFDAVCKQLAVRVLIRPATIVAMRAGCDSEVIAPPKRPLARNRDIVADSQVLIACPRGPVEVLRSGVWATIRAMRKKGGPLHVIAPDGSTIAEPAAGE